MNKVLPYPGRVAILSDKKGINSIDPSIPKVFTTNGIIALLIVYKYLDRLH
jgi:hypothetical protein